MDFGDRLRRLRIEKHMTQEQLADASGVSRASIVNYENKRRTNISHKVAFAISEVLNVDVQYLMTGQSFSEYMSEAEQRFESVVKILEVAGYTCEKWNIVDDEYDVHITNNSTDFGMLIDPRRLIDLVEKIVADSYAYQGRYIEERLRSEFTF